MLEILEQPDLDRPSPAKSTIGTLDRNSLEAHFRETLETRQFDVGSRAFMMFCELAPSDAYCAYLTGLLLQHAGRIAEALPFHERAVELDDQHVDYLFHLGGVLCQLQRFEDSRPYFQQVVKAQPRHAMAWYHLGGVFLKTQRLIPAEHAYRHSLSIDPTFQFAHYGLACVLLQRGKWNEGWSEFEWRWKSPEMINLVSSRVPVWNGEPIAGKRIIVMAEHGHGDTIQFARYIKQLHALGADIHLWAPFETVVLLARMPEVRNANMWGRNLPNADYYIPLLSLPRVLGALPNAIPHPPYLVINEDRKREFQAMLGARYERLRLGIAWAGNPENPDDRTRSASLDELAPLLKDTNIRWISLMKNDVKHEIRAGAHRIEDWSQHIESFDDTAALCSSLDGVVSVCTAPLHLAGALNIPTLGLLSSSPDWRWGEDPTTSAWYPSMTLVRQVKPGDWNSVALRARIYLARWRQRPESGFSEQRPVPIITGEFQAGYQPQPQPAR